MIGKKRDAKFSLSTLRKICFHVVEWGMICVNFAIKHAVTNLMLRTASVEFPESQLDAPQTEVKADMINLTVA